MSVDVELAKDAIYHRGLFVNRYAAIEFGLTHLLAVARECRAYSDLEWPPFKLASKLRRLGSLIEQPGPLANHAAKLIDHLAYFESIEESRHFIVHGVMVPVLVNDDAVCRFRVYQHREGDFHLGEWDLPLDGFRQLVNDIAPHSTSFSTLAASIAREMIGDAAHGASDSG